MASLLIRNLDPALHAQIKARARAHRRSLADEVLATLRNAIAREAGATEAPETLTAIAARCFGPEQGFELAPAALERGRAAPDFSGPDFA